jgi:hypothetical protein
MGNKFRKLYRESRNCARIKRACTMMLSYEAINVLLRNDAWNELFTLMVKLVMLEVYLIVCRN